MFSFSLKPLRLFSLFGLLTSLAAILLLIYDFVGVLFGYRQPGILTLIGLIVVQIAITSLGIGILGEYVGRTYTESKHRPLWIVDYALNFDDVIPNSYALAENLSRMDRQDTAVPVNADQQS